MENLRNVGFFLNLGVGLSAHKRIFHCFPDGFHCFHDGAVLFSTFAASPCCVLRPRHEDLESVTAEEMDDTSDISSGVTVRDSHFQKAEFRSIFL